MLYTFSQPDYAESVLRSYLQQMQPTDALLLWQDGLLLALKYPHLLQQSAASCYVLQADIDARQFQLPLSQLPFVQRISFEQWVSLTEQYFPQLAL